jgi:outer membrane protein TolC
MRFLVLFFLLIGFTGALQAQVEISSFEQFKAIADTSANAQKQWQKQQDLARLTTQSAFGNVLNPRVPVSASITNNSNLAVNFIPAEIFGGPAGTFNQVQFGQQYVTVLNIAPQFDILQPKNIGEVKSARLNEALQEKAVAINKKSYYEQLNAVYHNILSIKAQQDILRESVDIAQRISKVVNDKFEKGIASRSDRNDAEVNYLNLSNSLSQSEITLQQEYLKAKGLMDLDRELSFNESIWSLEVELMSAAANGELTIDYYRTKELFQAQEFKNIKLDHLPTLSFFSSFNWQNNSNASFLDSDQPWINSSFFGLRLTYEFPTNVSKLAAFGSSRINYDIAKLETEHQNLQAKVENQKLTNNYLQAVQSFQNAQSVFALEQSSFTSSQDKYEADILPLYRLLEAQNKMINSKLKVATEKATCAFQLQNIQINNSIK